MRCGGVRVEAGDIVVADEEGVVIVPSAQADVVLQKAQAHAAKDEADLDIWETAHRARTEAILRSKGFSDEAGVS